ncbi:MFS transporter [Limoniibacter endophyticus]|nr:MFS transporter [Limoniibacter endophyticus]
MQPEKVSRAGVFGWMAFDWAAQPFFTVVTTFIFGPYVVSQMASDPAAGQAAWGYGIALAGFCIAILSPILGAIADQTGARKRWIAGFAVIKIACLLLLWNSPPGSALLPVILLFSLASIAAEFSVVFNDSMMPRLIAPHAIGKVSNIAWGLGYLGGMVALIFTLVFFSSSPETGLTIAGIPPLFDLDPVLGEGARAVAPLAALWYAIFILPLLLFTPDEPYRGPISAAARSGVIGLLGTFREVRQRAGIFRFLVSRMIYQDGVNALIALGGAFAAGVFSWTITEVGLFGIILNIFAVAGCIAAGYIDRRSGSKFIIIVSLVLLLIATLGLISTGPNFSLFGFWALSPADTNGLFGTAAEKVYIGFALLVGLTFGPVQASSRSYLARSVEPEEAGRFFGIYALSGRATSFLVPLLVAGVTSLSGSARLGMSVIIVFLALGLLVLCRVPYPANK